MTEDDPTQRPAVGAELTGWPWLKVRLSRHIPELLRLAWPVVVARLGVMTLQLVDTVMVGRYDTQELAYQSVALMPTQSLLVMTLGLLVGTIVVAANAAGAGEHWKAGHAWRRSIVYAFWVGTVAAVLCQFGGPFLELTGQPPELVAGGAPLIAILGLGLPANLIFITSSFFLEGIKRPLAAMVVMVVGNLVNVFADWVLIYGHLGFPAMGAEGSAWTTTLVRIVIAVCIVGYIWHLLPDRELYAVRAKPTGGWRSWARQRHIGYASGLSSGVESISFAAIGLIAGTIGGLAIGTYAIVMNIVAFVFMVALGVATATAVRVGTAHGRRDGPDLALAGWTGLALIVLVSGVIAIGLALFGPEIASAYTEDPALLALAAPVIGFAALIVVADCGQCVMLFALRGRADVWVPTALHFISYVVLQIPCAYALGIVAGRGVFGLFEGVLIAAVFSVTALALRFWWLGRQDSR